MILLSASPAAAGDESAQSTLRSIRRGGRPAPPASCSRHERSLDTRYSCAASSRVESPTSLPPPPWPLLSLSGGSDANTPNAYRDRSAPPLALLRPRLGRAGRSAHSTSLIS